MILGPKEVKKAMLSQLNQTLVTLKVEQNQLFSPNCHLLLYGSSSGDIMDASPSQLASPKAKNHSMSGDILDPSPKMPCPFYIAGFLQSLNAELMGPVDCSQGTFGSMNQKRHRCENKVHMAPCIHTVPRPCRGHGYPSQEHRVSEQALMEKKSFGKFCMSQSSNRLLLCQKYCLSFMVY
uniref:Uncharacterized protein n=1 Tax=Mus musculus TaxID=10090 RepID=Q3TYJ8_MOUSE|nr:unnamed protein product [Mus musculus]